MSDFHFLRPYFFLCFIPFLIWIILRVRRSQSFSIWDKVCSKDLLPYVLGNKSKNQIIPYVFILLSGSLLITALAGPTWELTSHPLLKNQSGLVILLDLSPSMIAEDIKPSRMQRAIYKLTDILNLRKEGQTALIAFSADPYVVTPLTDDVATIKAMLPVLEPSIMPAPGHKVDKAMEKAIELLDQAGISQGSILLVGAELSDTELEKSIRTATNHGIAVSVLGIGTEEGAPLPVRGGGFTKDEKGALVVSLLSKNNLNRLAKSTGGSYVTITSDDKDIRELTNGFLNASIGNQEETNLTHDKWHDAGYWLVLCAIPFAALLFRRGVLGGVFTLAFFMIPNPIHALSWECFWKTSDKRAEELFHEEQYEEAKELFQDPDWQAATSYRLGDFKTAAELFKENQTVEGYYNRGTAMAKQGDYESALKSYAKALEIDPNHEDTLYNKKIIEELMEKNKQDQQQQGQQQDQNDQKDDSQSENSEQPSKDENEQQQSEEEEKDSDNSENEQQEQEQQQEETTENDEQKEIDDRWLQKVPDDPGGLLRRKFLQQYRHTKGNQ